MNRVVTIIVVLLTNLSFAQFPFEKYPVQSYTKYNKWTIKEEEERFTKKLSIPKFYKNGDTLTIEITSFETGNDSSFVKLFRNNNLTQTFFESATFSLTGSSDILYKADINGDHLLDLKLYAPQPGNGIALMNNVVFFLFQNKDETFTKIAFSDMFDYGEDSFNYRKERDFDGDHNYEIITMSLLIHGDHSYWKYDLYNYKDGKLVNVSLKNKYPILIQYLFRPNFKITNKISPQDMKGYLDELPIGYEKE